MIRAPKQPQIGFLESTYSTISDRARPLFQGGFLLMAFLSFAGAVHLLFNYTDFFFPFILIAGPALWGVWFWSKQKRIGLPILPIFLVQQALVYSMPLFHYCIEIPPNYRDVLYTSSIVTGIFFAFLLISWRWVTKRGTKKPSRFNLALGEGIKGEEKSLKLALSLLAVALLFHITARSGFLYEVLPDSLDGLIPIMRTFASAGAMLGALLGGIVIGNIPKTNRKFIYWSLILAISLISMADVLISAASSIILSAVVGMALGTGKPPYIILIITLGSVAFLNQGKTDLRQRYWVPGNLHTELAISDLPAFYIDWLETSQRVMFTSKEKAVTTEEGLSIFERINNLQNTLYVVDAIEHRNYRILYGETYALIPPLFVPRVFWPNKPRAHEGQSILNVKLGRQINEEATYKVYIAWGLLPEAIGNFGVYFGPVIFGIAMGLTIGWLERISMRKRILSVEGMTLGGLLLITAGSYEMVASVFLTSTFQFVIAVTLAGFILYYAFKKEPKRKGGLRA